MVVSLASGAPAEAAGVLPGDIVLDIGDTPVGQPRALAAAIGCGSDRPDRRAEIAPRRCAAVRVRHHRRPARDVSQGGLRIRIHTADPVRKRGLAAMLEAAGHSVTEDRPDVELCDGSADRPAESEAPVVMLTQAPPNASPPAGLLPPDAPAEQLDAALRAVAAGLLVRAPQLPAPRTRVCRRR